MKRRWKGKFMKPGKCARLEALSKKTRKTINESFEDENEKRIEGICIEDSEWGNGRRIIELRHLAEQLKACKMCAKPLLLHKTEREQQVGYASILYVSCDCGIINTVTTGKSHRPPDKSNRGMPVYDVNTKAVLGKFVLFLSKMCIK